MKAFISLALLAFLSWGCKKEKTDEPGQPEPVSKEVVLKEPVLAGDSIMLSWTVPSNVSVLSYEILRRDDSNRDFYLISPGKIGSENKVATDRDIPYTPKVEYQINVYTTRGKLVSNVVAYNRPEISIIDIQPFDVLYDNDNQRLYLLERNGKIILYDITQAKIVKEISTNAFLSYAGLGESEGRKELYVPRNDGWVFIYDAQTLEKIDQISLPNQLSSVAYQNGKLFTSTEGFTTILTVIERKTKTILSQGSYFTGHGSRLKVIPNTDTEFFAISVNVMPANPYYCRFTPSGEMADWRGGSYYSEYHFDASIFEVSPDGSKYITAEQGNLFKRDLEHVTTLSKDGSGFTSFAFDEKHPFIYAGTKSKAIEVYSIDQYQHVGNILTKGYPSKLFYANDQILSISKTHGTRPYWLGDEVKYAVTIEKLPVSN